MRKDKYIRVSTAICVVLTGGCGECKMRRSEHCKGCRTQTILDLLDDVAKTDGVDIPQRHGRTDDLDEIEEAMRIKCEEAKQKWRDSHKVTSNEYDEGYMDGWQSALDELHKHEPFISAEPANQGG